MGNPTVCCEVEAPQLVSLLAYANEENVLNRVLVVDSSNDSRRGFRAIAQAYDGKSSVVDFESCGNVVWGRTSHGVRKKLRVKCLNGAELTIGVRDVDDLLRIHKFLSWWRGGSLTFELSRAWRQGA